MGRVPPNKPSKNRKPNSKSKQMPNNQLDNTQRTVDRFYSLNYLVKREREMRAKWKINLAPMQNRGEADDLVVRGLFWKPTLEPGRL